MSWSQFVYDQIEKELLKLKYPPAIAKGGAAFGEDYYKRASQASAKGRIYDDCLRLAKEWAKKNTTASDRADELRVKYREAKASQQSALF
ncbi:hypothetical protein [Yersinia massiliensis]|uniref:hypothetical protein n=1 Tax=Yersinia massiliensis TaxID=419257 RepID=UPI0002FA7061|nr:hypothetical protein [Yersinia massiliensis]